MPVVPCMNIRRFSQFTGAAITAVRAARNVAGGSIGVGKRAAIGGTIANGKSAAMDTIRINVTKD